MQATKLLLLTLFFTQSVISKPFSYFKPWTWRMSAEEKQKKMDHLNHMYSIKSEFDDIEKVYKIVTAPVSIKEFEDNAFLVATRKNAGLFGTIFIQAQRKWNLTNYIYFGSSMDYFKEKVLMAAVEKAEKEARASKKNRPTSWHTQLKTEEKSYYCPGLYNGNKRAEFKEWQEEYEKDKPAVKERNDFFQQWRQKNRNYNKPEFNKI